MKKQAHRFKNLVGKKLLRLGAMTVLGLSTMSILLPAASYAQEPVVGVANPDALFTSSDPRLHANKQVAYHIVKDLLEAGHWEQADKYLSKRYIQHNPNAASGLDGVIKYFVEVRKVQAKPIPEKMTKPIVAVIAEGDLVTVMYPLPVRDKTTNQLLYTTTWFDTWRIVDGKADEHWDSALKN
ncbi:nuclear transport factor 2 family protein [Undibacterium sp. Ji49W]|uniref:nuclear transport factor 2 family protein n=1 Tax=Undibacterium sp. Ji49W TaxID=3413040 RepID=UPI003BEFB68A